MSVEGKNLHWYVLFVRTGCEEKVVARLEDNLDKESFVPFILNKTCVWRRKGQQSFFYKNCFPGYVFIESDKPAEEFLRCIFPVVYGIRDAYRILCYGDDRQDVAMREKERLALCKIFGERHCLDISEGFKEGDSIRVVSGALMGNESMIVRLDRNRKNAVIRVEMFGDSVEVSVGVEIIERVE